VPFMGLNEAQKRQLEMEVVPSETRLRLTRIIRDKCCCRDDRAIQLVRLAPFVNMVNHVMNRKTYILEGDDWGEYPHEAYAVLESERELMMRSPSTVQLAEILGDYLQADMLGIGEVNEVLAEANCGFAFTKQDVDADRFLIRIKVVSASEIPEADVSHDHPNIRVLVSRMDRALNDEDYAAVLHSSASIFEALAKDVVGDASVQNQTLASFFERYRKDSRLPDPLLDYILATYRQRNTTPLAGHGSMSLPTIGHGEAVVLAELTKAIIRSERKLALAERPDALGR